MIRKTNVASKVIIRENRKINNLYKEIENYETLIYVMEQVGNKEQIIDYREKIRQCYFKIDTCLEKMNNEKDRISTIRNRDKLIKRGESCA